MAVKLGNAYDSYLKSYEWALKRKEAFGFYGAVCSACGSKKDLQVHHLTYGHLFNEPLEDLQILCDTCHARTHGYEISRPRPGTSKKTFRFTAEAWEILQSLCEKRRMSCSEIIEKMIADECKREIRRKPLK